MPDSIRVARNAFGQCVVAARDLPGGTVVTRFTGPVVAYADVPADEICHVLLLDGDRWLVPGSPARFINHACEPNCCIGEQQTVSTLRPIAAGEELTISYNRVTAAEYQADPAAFFWDPRWSFTCACGSPQCSGRIDGYVIT